VPAERPAAPDQRRPHVRSVEDGAEHDVERERLAGSLELADEVAVDDTRLDLQAVALLELNGMVVSAEHLKEAGADDGQHDSQCQPLGAEPPPLATDEVLHGRKRNCDSHGHR
jgi:hypothetical protein